MIWRCTNQKCGTDGGGLPCHEFEADKPICPKCKWDGRKPEYKNRVIKLETLHLHIEDVNGPDIGNGARYRLACGGSMAGKRATAVTSVVNCPACKATVEFRNAMPDDERMMKDYELEIDLENKTVNTVEASPPAGK